MPDYYKIKSQDEKIFYLRSTVEERLMFDVLSQKKFSQYRTWDKDEREKFKEDFRKHENQFPIKGFLIFLLKLALALLLNTLIVIFPFFININLFRQTGGIFLTEIVLTAIAVPLSVRVVKNRVENYGIKKRHGLVALYVIMLIGFIFLMVVGLYNLYVFIKYTNYQIYTSKQLVQGYYYSILKINIGVVGLVILIKELKKVTFFSCKHCNRLNVLTISDSSSSESVHEHSHYEKGYCQDSVTDFSVDGSVYTAVTRTYVPGRTVYDGLYKHSSFEFVYRCPRCGKTANTEKNYYETKL